jgi:hypothetical protein
VEATDEEVSDQAIKTASVVAKQDTEAITQAFSRLVRQES